MLQSYTVKINFRKQWYTITHEIMGFFAHAQTVNTRPLFPPPTWPWYEANASVKTVRRVTFVSGLSRARQVKGEDFDKVLKFVLCCIGKVDFILKAE